MTGLLRRRSRIAVWLVLTAWLAIILGGCGPGTAAPEDPSQARTSPSLTSPGESSPTSTARSSLPTTDPTLPAIDPTLPTIDPTLPATDPASGLPFIEAADLPPEAVDTLLLIAEDGPFPFDRDGITFQNREELLPDRPGDYYREYTVLTPGLSHRGARRIVAGEGSERYYTADHYESFERIRLSGTDQ